MKMKLLETTSILILILASMALRTCLGADVASTISSAVFENLLKHRNDAACKGKGFYTYDAFLKAARTFPAFGTTGDDVTKKREIAAFFGQTSHETTGGWPTAPDGPYSWGYCFVREGSNTGPGFYGRGPIQLTQCVIDH